MKSKKTVKKQAEAKEKKQSIKISNDAIIYGVEWVEVEFGERDEGWQLFVDLEKCKSSTRESSRTGAYTDGSGYLGPRRPLYAIEIPFSSLSKDLKKKLRQDGALWTDNRWSPKFTGERIAIES